MQLTVGEPESSPFAIVSIGECESATLPRLPLDITVDNLEEFICTDKE